MAETLKNISKIPMGRYAICTHTVVDQSSVGANSRIQIFMNPKVKFTRVDWAGIGSMYFRSNVNNQDFKRRMKSLVHVNFIGKIPSCTLLKWKTSDEMHITNHDTTRHDLESTAPIKKFNYLFSQLLLYLTNPFWYCFSMIRLSRC